MSIAERKSVRLLFRLVFLGVTGTILLLIGAAVYLSTPDAALRFSHILTRIARHPVTVSSASLAGGGVRLESLTLPNPSGFTHEPFLEVRSLVVVPSWSALFQGKKGFRAIHLSGVHINLNRDRKGNWNFSQLLRSRGEQGGGETFIGTLTVSDAALSINGRRVENLQVTLRNVGTQGGISGMVLDCQDEGGNPVHLEGSVTSGGDASLALRATFRTFAPYATLFGKSSLRLDKGTGELEIAARQTGDTISVEGKIAAAGLAAVVAGENVPLKGNFGFSGRYDRSRDRATLERSVLVLNDGVTARGRGEISGLKGGEGRFAWDIRLDTVSVSELSRFLPSRVRTELAVGGTVSHGELHLSGNTREGVRDGSALLRLTEGELRRRGELFVSGLNAAFTIRHITSGWQVEGAVSRRGGDPAAALEALLLPATVRLSPRGELLQADLPSVSGRFRGIPFRGSLAYSRSAATPYHADLSIPATPAVAVQRLLSAEYVTLKGGKVALQVRAAGDALPRLTGSAVLQLSNIAGATGREPFSLERGAVTAAFGGVGRKVEDVAGTVDVTGVRFRERTLSLRCGYEAQGGRLALTGGDLRVDPQQIRFRRVGWPLPLRSNAAGGLPLDFQVEGVDFRQGELQVTGVAGHLLLAHGEEGRWGKGAGDVVAKEVLWQNRKLGGLSGHLNLDKDGGAMTMEAAPLGGDLQGEVSFSAHKPTEHGTFQARFEKVDAGLLDAVMGSRGGVTVTGGRLAGVVKGTYEGESGWSSRVEMGGEDLAIAVGGKGLSGLGVKMAAETAGRNLKLSALRITAPGGVHLEAAGKVADAASATRRGEIQVTVPSTPLNVLLDITANVLPAALQQGTAGGSAALQGTVRVEGGNFGITGTLGLAAASVEFPDQKLAISGVSGTIPFALSPGRAAPVQELSGFSRESHANLKQQLERSTPGGSVTIDRIGFGELLIPGTRLTFRVADGATELTGLHLPLFRGEVLGKGILSYHNGTRYALDLLLADLSLRDLSNSFPPIKGYISGKLDGIIGIRGGGAKAADLKGFVDLWTKESREEKRLVSKEFLQKLAGQKLKGIFFRNDRPYDEGRITAFLEKGFLTFTVLDISHTNLFGVRDLSVSVAPVSNRISLEHLLETIRSAAIRGKGGDGGGGAPLETEFKWQE